MRWIFLISVLCAAAHAAEPATRPSDPGVDWLLSHATTAPSTVDDDIPATQPAVLQSANAIADESRPGSVTMSDGKTITGKLSTTLRQPIRVWVDEKQEYRDIPFSMIQSMEAHVVWERQEKEWTFKESGSDVKDYSGRTYPARLTSYTVTLKDASTVTGIVAAPIYVENGDGRTTYVLHKTDKGEPGQTVGQLIYVTKVSFTN